MATDGGENTYHNAGGSTQTAGTFSMAEVDTTTPASSEESAISDEKLRVGLFSQPDTASDTRQGASLDVGFTKPINAFVEKFDQAQLATVMKEFGDCTIVDLIGDTGKAKAANDTKTSPHEAQHAQEVAQHDEASDGYDEDDDDDEVETYAGDRETQEALARVGTVVSRDSQIPDRLLQTLDRLNRRETMSA